MSRWRGRRRGALPLTELGHVEIVNGICLAGFQKAISREAMSDALASFGEDLREDRCLHADVLWRATLRRAGDMSRAVLHVAMLSPTKTSGQKRSMPLELERFPAVVVIDRAGRNFHEESRATLAPNLSPGP